MEAETWVAVCFIVFLALLIYLGAHRKIVEALDRRQMRVKMELDEAMRLRQEAQTLLAEFERKGREAEREAEVIISNARAEAERLADEAKTKMEDFVARRSRMAEDKIALAEAQALADVRSAAADAAVSVAEIILKRTVRSGFADSLTAQSVEQLKGNGTFAQAADKLQNRSH